MEIKDMLTEAIEQAAKDAIREGALPEGELPQVILGSVLYDTECRQRVEAELPYPLRLLSEQDVSDHLRAVRSLHSGDTAEHLARLDAHVDLLELRVAVSAVTAVTVDTLAEIVQYIPSQAFGRCAVPRHLVQTAEVLLLDHILRLLIRIFDIIRRFDKPLIRQDILP